MKIFVAGVRAGAEHAAAGLPPVLRGGGRLLHPPQVRAPRRQGSRPVILRRIGEASSLTIIIIIIIILWGEEYISRVSPL